MTTRRWLLAAALTLSGWIGVQALVMVLTDAAPGAIALLPPDTFLTRLPPDIGFAGEGRFWVAIKGDGPGLGLAAYRAGAWLVLPAGLPGCLPLPT